MTNSGQKMLADLRIVDPNVIVTKDKYLLAAQIKNFSASKIACLRFSPVKIVVNAFIKDFGQAAFVLEGYG